MKSKSLVRILVPTLLLPFSTVVRGGARLPAIFSDNMVLQQGVRVPIWGWADDGEEITVTFRGQTAKVKAHEGKWMVKLRRLEVGGPDDLVVLGKNKIELKNVLVGEVWICSGQSNMEWTLDKACEAAPDVEGSANPMLRLCFVPKTKANLPMDDVKAQWKECNPKTVPGFSAVAYYFGRDLQKALKVPVGLIETCWGGSPAEVWMSERVLSSNPDYKRDILDTYEAAVKSAEATNTTAKVQRPGWKPTELYNGMIAPLVPFAIKGAIWYQGESNAGRAHQYRTLFPDMIRNSGQDW